MICPAREYKAHRQHTWQLVVVDRRVPDVPQTMSWPLVCVFAWLCVTVSVTEGRRDSRRAERQNNGFTAAVGSHNAPVYQVRSAQCLVNGILLFEGAAWSPDACSKCQCRNGKSSCRAVPCQDTVFPASRPAIRKHIQSGMKLDAMSRGQNGRQQTVKARTEVRQVLLENKPKTQASSPPAATRKQSPPVRKRQEVAVRAEKVNKKLNVDQSPVIVPLLRFRERMRYDSDDHDDDDYMENNSDSHDDDDDDVAILYNTPTGRAGAYRPVMLPVQNPALHSLQKPLVPPTRQSMVLPTGRPLSVPTRQRGVGRPVIRPYHHMESLPAGCLLSESLIVCGNTGLTHLPILKDAGIRTLSLSDNKISKVPVHALAGLPNLEWLDLSKNKLDDASLGLDVFRNLTKLRRLNLDGNNFTKVPALPPSLVELKINDNRLSGLTPHSFRGLSQLLTLELEDNDFHDGNVSPLAFRNLHKLIYLRLDDNDFRAIPSGLPPSIQELQLSDNRIEVIHSGLLNKTVNLRVLNLSHNKIREDRIAPRAWIHLRKLESLDLSYNKLVHVPSFLPMGLRQLTLHHNQIERIPGYVFGHLKPGLDSLQLSYNRLREDGMNAVSFVGLYHSLTELLLDHNQLRSIPHGIIQLRALQLLRLNSNYISFVPMNALCDTTAREDSTLLSVHLENNLIDRRLIPPMALSCIRNYHSVVLRPQRHDEIYE